MIWTITLTLTTLVAVNFLLLVFSCNKTTRREPARQPRILRKEPTKQSALTQLAPTGS